MCSIYPTVNPPNNRKNDKTSIHPNNLSFTFPHSTPVHRYTGLFHTPLGHPSRPLPTELLLHSKLLILSSTWCGMVLSMTKPGGSFLVPPLLEASQYLPDQLPKSWINTSELLITFHMQNPCYELHICTFSPSPKSSPTTQRLLKNEGKSSKPCTTPNLSSTHIDPLQENPTSSKSGVGYATDLHLASSPIKSA